MAAGTSSESLPRRSSRHERRRSGGVKEGLRSDHRAQPFTPSYSSTRPHVHGPAGHAHDIPRIDVPDMVDGIGMNASS